MSSERSEMMRRNKNGVGIKVTDAGAIGTTERRTDEGGKQRRVVIQAVDAVFIDPHKQHIFLGHRTGSIHLVRPKERIWTATNRTATALHLHIAPTVCADEVECRISGLFHMFHAIDFIEERTNRGLIVVPVGTIVGVRRHLSAYAGDFNLGGRELGDVGRQLREPGTGGRPESPRRPEGGRFGSQAVI